MTKAAFFLFFPAKKKKTTHRTTYRTQTNTKLSMDSAKKTALREMVQTWIGLDASIADKRTELRTLAAQKAHLTKQLVEAMQSNQLDSVNLEGGSVSVKRTVTRKPLSQKELRAELLAFFGDTQPDVADQLATHLRDRRAEHVVETLQFKR